MRMLAIAAAGLAAFATLVAMMIVLVRLRPHRTDLRPEQHFGEGRSAIWQVNALDPRNYDAGGRALLRWLFALQVLWILSLIAMATRFMGLW